MRKAAKRNLRSAIRRATREINENHLSKIVDAHLNDTNLFHQLIKAPHSEASSLTNLLVINQNKLTDPAEICSSFRDHFYNLANRADEDDQSCEEREYTNLRNSIIKQLCKLDVNKIIPISPEEMKKLISTFKNGKSQDPFNATAEHPQACR